MGRITTFKWLPWGEPVPEGWELAEDLSTLCHHNNYAVLIKEVRAARDLEQRLAQQKERTCLISETR